MSNMDNDLFNLFDTISDDEKMKLLDSIYMSEFKIETSQKNRIKSNVMNSINNSSVKRKKINNKVIIAASIVFFIILTSISPIGQKALADIAHKLYFIPGTGNAIENKGQDIFILPYPVNTDNITISSIIKNNAQMNINLYASKSSNFSTLTIEDNKGNIYISTGSSTAMGENFLGMYDFSNIPNSVYDFNIILPNNVKIPITLKKADAYEDYASMGPTDIKNNLGITLVPQKLGEKIHVNLIQHPSKDKQIFLYGKSDKDGHSNDNIIIKDEKGKSYEVDYPKAYAGTLSDFEFTPDNNSLKYTVQIPEITLKYNVDNKITLPMLKEGETQVNKNVTMHGFSLKITKIVREGTKATVYVDTNFNVNKPENLSIVNLDMTAMSLNNYKWNLNNHIAVDSYEFNINPKDSKLTIKFNEMYTIMKGPWTFEINPK